MAKNQAILAKEAEKRRFYNLTQSDDGNVFLNIFGDITSEPWCDEDVSLSKVLSQLEESNAKHIHVSINSYGGEVAEGLAIYNTLKNHTAKVTTECTGFACSIASVIFMAGDERIMNASSLLMIHNPWTMACGNADDMRKVADDLEIIGGQTKRIYTDAVNLSGDDVQNLLDNESWITPEQALEWGFCTAIRNDEKQDGKPSQSAKSMVFQAILAYLNDNEECAEADEKSDVPEDVESETNECDVPGNVFKQFFKFKK